MNQLDLTICFIPYWLQLEYLEINCIQSFERIIYLKLMEVPDRVRPGRQFAMESRKPFVLTAKLTTYPCRMKTKCEVIIPASPRLPIFVKIGQKRHLLKLSKITRHNRN
ncbi:uncharacterized protein LOC116929877 [Daphnia magna]|uniref:uncharacterized protein LOC116929877 n=1 Tax=Daphnia magna TaxID=35525 RepID=UPI001E1BD423|nr:uncharacterized protein LOC116929877 [Daphnia magna]